MERGKLPQYMEKSDFLNIGRRKRCKIWGGRVLLGLR